MPTLTAEPLADVEGESLGWADDDILLLALLLASDVSRADAYWRLIAPAGWLNLLSVPRFPEATPLGASFIVEDQYYRIPSRGLTTRKQSRPVIRGVIRQAVANAESRAVNLARSLTSGVLPVDQWQRAMAAEIRQASATFAAVGAGGSAGVTDPIIEDARQRMEFQFKRLETYAKSIEQKEPAVARSIETRPTSYLRHAGMSTHAEAERISHETEGFLQEISILDPNADHCKPNKKRPDLLDCPTVSAKGWSAIGTLPQIGSRACFLGCRCHFEFRKVQGRISEN